MPQTHIQFSRPVNATFAGTEIQCFMQFGKTENFKEL
jgi:hypothetical protein